MNIENPRITMMTADLDGNVAGRVVLNCCEWVVQPFQVGIGASASDKENKLIEQAISVKRKAVDKQENKLMDWVDFKKDDDALVSERQNDGMKTIKVSIGDL